MKRLALLLAVCAVAVLPARAQFHIGAHGGYDLGVESGFAGVTTHFVLPGTGLVLAPSLDFFFNADLSVGALEVNQDLAALHLEALYLFGVNNQVFTPYVGVGASLIYSNVDDAAFDLIPALDLDDSSTDVGFNLTGGAIFGSGPLRPFAAARVQLEGEELTSLLGGLMLTF